MSAKISNELLMVIGIAIIAGILLFCANGKREGMSWPGGQPCSTDDQCKKPGSRRGFCVRGQCTDRIVLNDCPGRQCQLSSDCKGGGKCINRCCAGSPSSLGTTQGFPPPPKTCTTNDQCANTGFGLRLCVAGQCMQGCDLNDPGNECYSGTCNYDGRVTPLPGNCPTSQGSCIGTCQ